MIQMRIPAEGFLRALTRGRRPIQKALFSLMLLSLVLTCARSQNIDAREWFLQHEDLLNQAPHDQAFIEQVQVTHGDAREVYAHILIAEYELFGGRPDRADSVLTRWIDLDELITAEATSSIDSIGEDLAWAGVWRSIIAFRQGKYNQTLDWNRGLKDWAEHHNDSTLLMWCKKIDGNVMKRVGLTANALENYQDCEAYFHRTADFTRWHSVRSDMANVLKVENQKIALDFRRGALRHYQRLGYRRNAVRILLNMSGGASSLSESMRLMRLAEEEASKLEDPIILSELEYRKVSIMKRHAQRKRRSASRWEKQDPDSASYLRFQADSLCHKALYQAQLVDSLARSNRLDVLLAKLYPVASYCAYVVGNDSLDKAYTHLSIDYNQRTNNLHQLQESYEVMAGFHSDARAPDSAFYYQQLAFEALEDEMKQKDAVRTEVANLIIEDSQNYKSLVKEQALTSAQELEISEQKSMLRSALLVIIIIALLAAGIIIYVQHRRKKAELKLQNRDLEAEQQVLQLVQHHKRELLEQSLEVREAERQHLAQELHDGVAGKLAGISIVMNDSNRRLDGDLRAELGKELSSAYDMLRSLSRSLSQAQISDNTLIELISDLLRKVHVQHGIYTELEVEPPHQPITLSDEVTASIYRIIQEQTTNMLKHSQATAYSIQLVKKEEALEVSMADNGKGFDPKKVKKGLGLKSLENRMKALKGNYSFYQGQAVMECNLSVPTT